MEENNNSNPEPENIENTSDNPEVNSVSSSSDFSSNLDAEQSGLTPDKFAEQQAHYRQMLGDNNTAMFEDPYMYRISFGRRFGGYLIDNFVYTIIFMFILSITGSLDNLLSLDLDVDSNMFSDPDFMSAFVSGITTDITPIIIILTLSFYSLEVIFAQSVGKMILGIKIGSIEPGFASYQQLLLRLIVKCSATILTLFFVITSLTFFETLSSLCSFVIFIGCFFVLGQKRQALHDTVSGTAVYFKDELSQFDSYRSSLQ